jgi:hypothetical protein
MEIKTGSDIERIRNIHKIYEVNVNTANQSEISTFACYTFLLI